MLATDLVLFACLHCIALHRLALLQQMDVFKQRLCDEHDCHVLVTSPTCAYTAHMLDGSTVTVDAPSKYIAPGQAHPSTFGKSKMTHLDYYTEPVARCTIISPAKYEQELVEFATAGQYRGAQVGEVVYLSHQTEAEAEAQAQTQTQTDDSDSSVSNTNTDLIELKFDIPLRDILTSFYNGLKSLTSGYASFDYTTDGIEPEICEIVKLDVKLNGVLCDPLSTIVLLDDARDEARQLTSRLADLIERQSFQIQIQVFQGSQSLSQERISPWKKDVLTKSGKTVGGGDKTRKQKLLAKQAEGKKRMKAVGNVQISEDVFAKLLKI